MSVPVVFRNHFQLGYVVRNLYRAVEHMRDKFGVAKWQVNRMPKSAPARVLGFAYVQKVMIELIEARPELDTIYRDWIPESETAARLHHLGYMMDSAEEWHRVIDQFQAGGFRAALTESSNDLFDYYYSDTVAQLGHYCELIFLKPAGRTFWADVPRN